MKYILALISISAFAAQFKPKLLENHAEIQGYGYKTSNLLELNSLFKARHFQIRYGAVLAFQSRGLAKSKCCQPASAGACLTLRTIGSEDIVDESFKDKMTLIQFPCFDLETRKNIAQKYYGSQDSRIQEIANQDPYCGSQSLKLVIDDYVQAKEPPIDMIILLFYNSRTMINKAFHFFIVSFISATSFAGFYCSGSASPKYWQSTNPEMLSYLPTARVWELGKGQIQVSYTDLNGEIKVMLFSKEAQEAGISGQYTGSSKEVVTFEEDSYGQSAGGTESIEMRLEVPGLKKSLYCSSTDSVEL